MVGKIKTRAAFGYLLAMVFLVPVAAHHQTCPTPPDDSMAEYCEPFGSRCYYVTEEGDRWEETNGLEGLQTGDGAVDGDPSIHPGCATMCGTWCWDADTLIEESPLKDIVSTITPALAYTILK